MGSLRFVPAADAFTVLASWPVIVTVPSSVAGSLIESLWAAVGSPTATVESVVSSIPFRGEQAVGSFSVVVFSIAPPSLVDPVPADPVVIGAAYDVTVVTRGAAAVDLLSVGGSRRFGSGGAEPWALAEFRAVTGVSIGALPPVPESSLRLPPEARRLDRGIAEASSAVWAASSASFDEVHASPDLEATMRSHPLTAHPLTADDQGRGLAAHPARSDDTPMGIDDLDAHTDTRRDRSAGDDDDAAADPPPAFHLRINDEAPRHLTGAVVIGRNPRRSAAAPTAAGHPASGHPASRIAVAVSSPAQEVSSEHVEIALSGRTVVITDLRSTNGTRVLLPGRPAARLRQGDSIVATGSAIVEIGDGNVIHISSSEPDATGITV